MRRAPTDGRHTPAGIIGIVSMELLAWNVAYSANISRIIEVYLIPGRPRPKSGMWESSQPNPYSVFPFQLVLSSRYLVDSAVEFCLFPIDFGLITPGLAVVPASLLAEVLLFAGFYRNHFALRKSLSCMKLSLSAQSRGRRRALPVSLPVSSCRVLLCLLAVSFECSL